MSGGTRLENANPLIFQRSGERLLTSTDEDEDVADPIDVREIFDILSQLSGHATALTSRPRCFELPANITVIYFIYLSFRCSCILESDLN